MGAREQICDEILRIMKVYHQQMDAGNLGTPGGLEHMGDVWKLFERWDNKLKDENSNFAVHWDKP